jgi:hypothetical protein
MNNFKNMSKKKSFCNALFNEFFGSILLVLFITYIAAFIILGKAGIFNFIGGDSNIANGFVAAVFFPIVLGLVLLAIVLIVSVLGFIPHKVRAVYNYTYLPLTVDEIRDALDKGVISSKEDYIRLILNSLRYGAMKKPSSWFSAYYITFSQEELYSLCKSFEEVFDSPIIIDNDMLSYINKYDGIDTPFDNAKYKGEVLLRDIRQKYENGKDATFALYVDGDKYKEMLETIEFPIYVGR